MPRNHKELLATLVEAEGVDLMDLLEEHMREAVGPGICWVCRRVSPNMEPDQRRGWCEDCATNSVISGPVLAGIL